MAASAVSDWRWQHVDGMVAIDNRPAVDAAEYPPGPQYQSMVVPMEVLEECVRAQHPSPATQRSRLEAFAKGR